MENKFELTAIVELFGHTKLAGQVSEITIGSASFIRIDVPDTKSQPSFSKIVNPSAVYAINPVTEDVMKLMAEDIQEKPIEAWDIQRMNQKLLALNESTKD